jgi:hypothetical protein
LISHSTQSEGKWFELDLANQLGNIGSEVDRIKKWQDKNNQDFAQKAFWRALELIDLTRKDPRWKGAKAKELGRLREVFCDTVTNDGKLYNTPLEYFQKYFMDFALVARKRHLEKRRSL